MVNCAGREKTDVLNDWLMVGLLSVVLPPVNDARKVSPFENQRQVHHFPRIDPLPRGRCPSIERRRRGLHFYLFGDRAYLERDIN